MDYNNLPLNTKQNITRLFNLKQQIETLKSDYERVASTLKSEMETSDIGRITKGKSSITLVKQSETLVLNTEKLKTEYNEIYNLCKDKTRVTQSYLKLNIK